MNSIQSKLETIDNLKYGVRLAILYGIVWFIDLLDASILNVALPSIAQSFDIDATNAEWAIVGFLLALTISIPISSWLGDRLGLKALFIWSQALFTLSSIACGFSSNLEQLIAFRIIQGSAGGLLIPVGLTLIQKFVPQANWAKVSSKMNMTTLIAPAIGPVIAGYVIEVFGWRWLFFIKIPLSIGCFVLSFIWIKKDELRKNTKFDWLGCTFSILGLGTLFIGLSELGKDHLSSSAQLVLFLISFICLGCFLFVETKNPHPMISLSIFRYPLFRYGNLIQCAANMIFLGATFITALYLQQGLKMTTLESGWILAAITPGMLCVLPLVSRFYNRIGPIPFIIPGLFLMSFSMYGFLLISETTSAFFIAFLIFCEGVASAIIQTPNVIAIFSEVPKDLKSAGSALYSLGKQLSASLGVALSVMILSVSLSINHVNSINDVAATSNALTLFHYTFIVLGTIPLLAIGICFFYSNKKALKAVT